MCLLADWIRLTLDDVDLSAIANASAAGAASGDPSQWPINVRNSLALCSGEYLMLALRVALSLAEGICEAEDEVARGDRTKVWPAPRTNWSDRVQVCLSLDGTNIKQNAFKFKNAVFMPLQTDEIASDGLRIRDNMQRIYSLGIVFYEIFSGGQRPPELQKRSNNAKGGGKLDDETAEVISQEWSPEASENFDFLDTNNDGSDIVDLADKLHTLDGMNPDTGDLFSDIEGDEIVNNQITQKRQVKRSDYQLGDMTVEPLKAKCIPRSVCDLIANMLDCGCDNRGGDDTYRKMSEVRDDLSLILEKPATYLYDKDMGKLSLSGLQLGDAMFGRNAQLSAVKNAYKRSLSGRNEMVMISGASGTGKSILGYEFGKHVLEEGGIFLSGKFDQLQQGKPFSALASAFDMYCGLLLGNSAPSYMAVELASKLRLSLEGDVHHLTKLIPNLATILGLEILDINYDDEYCVHAEKRLQYLLSKFIEVVSVTFSAPVVLFLDDLQWGDAASAEAVRQLLIAANTSSLRTHFFFLGCTREDEIHNEHPVSKLLRNAESSNTYVATIKLDMLEESTINTMVSETLCLLPRLTSSLSNIIYRKTKGNPLFVSQLLVSLNKEGLLCPSLSQCRWVWDEERIESRNLPDDVAMFLHNTISELPEEVQSSLCTLSCFGASVDIDFIETLERALQRQIRVYLDAAVKKGLLGMINSQYRFSHDRIQEATYNMMGEDSRRLFHFTYGLSLASLSIDESSDSILFIAVNQLNLGGPAAMKDPSQSYTIADMNLTAGKKAMEMSDFRIASSYIDHGISFLPEHHWEEHYDLSLELFELAAKCALTNGDHTRVKQLSEQVLDRARFFQDKLEVTYAFVRSLLDASRLGEALTKLLYVLNELGIVLSGNLENLLHQTNSVLANYSDDQLQNLPLMTNRTQLMAMKFLLRAQTCLLQKDPKSQPEVILHMIQYSLRHGVSGLSSVGFAFYGSFLACLGDIPAGYRYVKIGIKLAEKLNARECMCEVLAVGCQVMGYVEPLQSVIDLMIRGHEYGLKVGNTSNAILSLSLSTTCSFWSGKQLSFVKSDMLRVMSSHSTLVWMLQTLPLYRTVLAMIGNVEDVDVPNINILGSRADVETEKEKKMCDTNLHLLKIAHFNKMYVGFMFRRYEEVKQLAIAYKAIASLPFSSILISHCMHVFYVGLINFWIARKTMDVDWFDRGENALDKMRSLAACSSWNFQNKLLLLQAEQCFYLEDFETAKSCYDSSILSAREHKFVHEEALAYELAGHFLLETGEGSSSYPYYLLAQTRYREW